MPYAGFGVLGFKKRGTACACCFVSERIRGATAANGISRRPALTLDMQMATHRIETLVPALKIFYVFTETALSPTQTFDKRSKHSLGRSTTRFTSHGGPHYATPGPDLLFWEKTGTRHASKSDRLCEITAQALGSRYLDKAIFASRYSPWSTDRMSHHDGFSRVTETSCGDEHHQINCCPNHSRKKS